MTSFLRCVIDTNICIKQFIADPLTPKVNQSIVLKERSLFLGNKKPGFFVLSRTPTDRSPRNPVSGRGSRERSLFEEFNKRHHGSQCREEQLLAR